MVTSIWPADQHCGTFQGRSFECSSKSIQQKYKPSESIRGVGFREDMPDFCLLGF